jgi:REP element-mobilizing transposase RayT
MYMLQHRRSNKTLFSAEYHLIWCPKYRHRVLPGEVEARLTEVAVESHRRHNAAALASAAHAVDWITAQ